MARMFDLLSLTVARRNRCRPGSYTSAGIARQNTSPVGSSYHISDKPRVRTKTSVWSKSRRVAWRTSSSYPKVSAFQPCHSSISGLIPRKAQSNCWRMAYVLTMPSAMTTTYALASDLVRTL